MARKKKEEMPQETISEEAIFTREELLKSKRFENERDVLNILLIPDSGYKIPQVEALIEAWKKEEEQC